MNTYVYVYVYICIHLFKDIHTYIHVDVDHKVSMGL